MSKLYNVTTTAQIAGVHPQTLRHWERIGLVVPTRTLGGVRRYSEYDILKLQTVRQLTELGINLEGAKIIIEQREEINILRRQLVASTNGSVFTSGEGGVTVEQYSKMSLRQRLQLMKRIRREQRKRMLEDRRTKLLQLEPH